MSVALRVLLALSLCLFVQLATACAASQNLPTYPRVEIDQMTRRQTQQGLTIALEPITGKSDQEKYFGVHLESIGCVPILIAARNDNPETSFILRAERIEMLAGSGNETSVSASDDTSLPGVSDLTTAMRFLFQGPLGVALARADRRVSNFYIENHLRSMAFRSETLSPCTEIQGLGYFPLPEASDLRSGPLRIRVECENIGRKPPVVFLFELSLAEKDK